MSCCGCASRVLKLQSEIRSWKGRLGDETREKKMILKWIMAVFGYDVRVDIEKETHRVRIEAMENKEAVTKALIKLGIENGDGGDLGMMVMELNLEDHEFYEPFEDPYETTAEFPILEINSMSQPLVNAGISSISHHVSHSQQSTSQGLSVITPMEVTPNAISVNPAGNEHEVLYLSGNFEEGATLEGLNGHSYVVVRATDNEDVPVQWDYSGIAKDAAVGDGNLYYRLASPTAPNPINTISYLSTSQRNSNVQSPQPQFRLPTITTVREPCIVTAKSLSPDQASAGGTHSNANTSVKRKSCIPNKEPAHSASANKSSTKKKKSEMNIQIKDVSSKSPFSTNSNKSKQSSREFREDKPKPKQGEALNSNKKDVFEFGLTLREKAEIYVLRKAKEAVEKIPTGYRCTVCEENRYTYSNFETAMAHTKSHYVSKPYKCEYCDELFSIQRELLTHRKTVHPKPKGAVTSMSSRVALGRPIGKPTVTTERVQIQTTLGNAASSCAPVSQAKTIVVQAPFDKNIICGPISISSDVLAALFESNSPIMTVSEADSVSVTKSLANPNMVKSQVPSIVIASSSKDEVKTRTINLSDFSYTRTKKAQ